MKSQLLQWMLLRVHKGDEADDGSICSVTIDKGGRGELPKLAEVATMEMLKLIKGRDV